MLIELNGLSFHLDIVRGTGSDGMRARIVDEAFLMPPLERDIADPAGVIGLIVSYSGIVPDSALSERIVDRIWELAVMRKFCELPAPRDIDRRAAAG